MSELGVVSGCTVFEREAAVNIRVWVSAVGGQSRLPVRPVFGGAVPFHLPLAACLGAHFARIPCSSRGPGGRVRPLTVLVSCLPPTPSPLPAHALASRLGRRLFGPPARLLVGHCVRRCVWSWFCPGCEVLPPWCVAPGPCSQAVASVLLSRSFTEQEFESLT